ncbi:MAG: response regulator [Dehalococcoidia bacterium]|nr:response regulator [Dehalococcoidia bacterium]
MEELQPLVILLVEDDVADQKLIRTSLKNQRVANELHVVGSGEEAMDFLYCRGDYSDGTSRPDLILLDLNMPGMGGREFLKRIKNDERLKQIPVVILTTSESERDIIDSYRLQASGYVNKPVTLEEFRQVMEKIGEYWFLVCRRVPREG